MLLKNRRLALAGVASVFAVTNCNFIQPIGRTVIGLDSSTGVGYRRTTVGLGPVVDAPGMADMFGSGIGGSPNGLSGSSARTIFGLYPADYPASGGGE